MIKVSKQQVLERYDNLSDNLRTFLVSDKTVDTLWLIGEIHHLNEERIKKIAGVVGYCFLGLIHIEDLAKEVAVETNIDRRMAEEIAREIQFKILNPVIPQLQQLYHYGSASSPQAAPAVPTEPVVMRPAFAPPISSDQPFILHEERGEVERARPRDETLVRPSFYEGPDTSNQSLDINAERAVARLEIGGVGEEKTKEPQMGKTEEPPIRVVHYSGPQTPVDPFAPQQMAKNEEQRVGPQQPPKDINPENIVDLKDLPR